MRKLEGNGFSHDLFIPSASARRVREQGRDGGTDSQATATTASEGVVKADSASSSRKLDRRKRGRHHSSGGGSEGEGRAGSNDGEEDQAISRSRRSKEREKRRKSSEGGDCTDPPSRSRGAGSVVKFDREGSPASCAKETLSTTRRKSSGHRDRDARGVGKEKEVNGKNSRLNNDTRKSGRSSNKSERNKERRRSEAREGGRIRPVRFHLLFSFVAFLGIPSGAQRYFK